MKLGLQLGMWRGKAADPVPLALEAERLGLDSVWASEAWSNDAVTPLAWVAARTSNIGVGSAVMQIPARTPAATAMTAATLDHLSGGRFRLGLGMSGPQVVEGWHGVPFAEPLARTREYLEVVRSALRGDGPLEHAGRFYPLPLETDSGLGKPLKLGVHPLRPDLPIHLAALGPRNVALAAEIADGWLALLLSPERMDVFRGPLEEGLALRAGTLRPRAGFEISALVQVAIGEDVQACRDAVRPALALYVGAFGSRERNFYNALVRRYGYEAEAERVQELFLAGKHREGTAAFPDALVDELALVGPVGRVRERLSAWREAGVTTLIAQTSDVATLRGLAEATG